MSRVYVVAETDGYDAYRIVAIYDNRDAADHHADTLTKANARPDGSPGADYGQIEEFTLESEPLA